MAINPLTYGGSVHLTQYSTKNYFSELGPKLTFLDKKPTVIAERVSFHSYLGGKQVFCFVNYLIESALKCYLELQIRNVIIFLLQLVSGK